MKKNIIINPIGLKGNQINERMKDLMGIKPIVKTNSRSAIELTKLGPDGNAYAIVRENHEYYIKIATKKENILSEDFKYIGGLNNKKTESYPSYSQAIKHLSLKFKSLAETHNNYATFNIFENDNLIKESYGFSGEGNLEGDKELDVEKPIEETEEVELSEDEKAIDAMLKSDDSEDEEPVTESKLSIAKALRNMDSIIDGLTEGSLKKKV